jgi:hypothetical protein
MTMRGKYDQIEAPGQVRTRSQKQTVVTPYLQVPSIEISEQLTIGVDSNGEEVFRETPAFSVVLTAERLAKPFQLRNPVDDTLLGQEITGNQAMAFYYSFVRDCQLERDDAEQTPPMIESGE